MTGASSPFTCDRRAKSNKWLRANKNNVKEILFDIKIFNGLIAIFRPVSTPAVKNEIWF